VRCPPIPISRFDFIEMIQPVINTLWAVVGAGAIFSLVSAIMKKWRFAYRLSKTTTLAVIGIVIIEILIASFFVLGITPMPEGVNTKAEALGKGISDIKNSGALAFSVLLFAAPVWRMSRSKSAIRK
jgi:hypothetical protein